MSPNGLINKSHHIWMTRQWILQTILTKKWDIQAHVCPQALSVESQSRHAHSFPIKKKKTPGCISADGAWHAVWAETKPTHTTGRRATQTRSNQQRGWACGADSPSKLFSYQQQFKSFTLCWFYLLRFCSTDSSWGAVSRLFFGFRGFGWFCRLQ